MRWRFCGMRRDRFSLCFIPVCPVCARARAYWNLLRVPGRITVVGKLRYDLLDLGQDRSPLAERHGDIEFVQAALQRRPGEFHTFRTGDLCAGTGKDPFVGVEEFLEQFFARTEADKLELLCRLAGEA